MRNKVNGLALDDLDEVMYDQWRLASEGKRRFPDDNEAAR